MVVLSAVVSAAEGLAVLGWIVVVVAVIALGIWAWKQDQKRRHALRAWASHGGFTYDEGRDSTMDERFPLFGRLREGSNRYAYNVMTGDRDGRRACCFDYHYETYSHSKNGRQTHHHHFSALVLETGLPLKPLFLRPEGFFDKVTEFVGLDDIDFESHRFSSEFYVKAPEKRWAFDVLHQATMEFLLAAPRYHVEVQGPWVMAWRSGRFKPVDFSGALYVVEGILDRLPKYLIQDLHGAGP